MQTTPVAILRTNSNRMSAETLEGHAENAIHTAYRSTWQVQSAQTVNSDELVILPSVNIERADLVESICHRQPTANKESDGPGSRHTFGYISIDSN
jgi:hypothetical protein